jgi:hypothetical protein
MLEKGVWGPDKRPRVAAWLRRREAERAKQKIRNGVGAAHARDADRLAAGRAECERL